MLTKSDYLKYLQCQKYLWLHKNRKDLIDGISEAQQAIFDQGYEVERYARMLFGEGIEVEQNFSAGREETKRYVKDEHKTIFQATAMPEDLLARADILHYNEETEKWDIYEVKSTTEVDKTHIPDLAFQKVAFTRDGYDIGKTFLVCINHDYVRQGDIDPEKLFLIEDVTEEVSNTISIVEGDIPKALATIKPKGEPNINIGKQCDKPHACAFKDYCWKDIPKYSIYDVTGIREKKLQKLIDLGILHITDIPDDFELSQNQQNQVMAAKSGTPIISQSDIDSILGSLMWPLYFLDYESFAPAIPLFDGTKPYQQVCFQYSLHILRSPNDEPEHYEFLHTKTGIPIEDLLTSMRKNIGDEGTIIVWNKSFEATRNKEMGIMYPTYAAFLNSVNERMFDLRDIFTKQHFVHPEFKGSTSIKNVLPVLVPELSYKELEIHDGGTASLRWYTCIYKNSPEKQETTDYLLKYCGLDSLAMVRIFERLSKNG